MGKRRRARELALQALYQIEMNEVDSEDIISSLSGIKGLDETPEVIDFSRVLIEGVKGQQEKIDRIIEEHSEHWKLSRMSYIDRNILRIAVYELLFLEDIPDKVTINESIDIGKKYGTEDSGSFINGILDRVASMNNR